MKHQIKKALRGLAKHFGLKVKYVSYFSDDVHGKLLPRERRILINAHKPRCEHIFTLLHEIGHFLLHFKMQNRKHHPHFLEIPWKTEWLAGLCSKVKRSLRYAFNKESGKEWEADLWAFCAFIYFANQFGCRDDLLAFLDRHPKKRGSFYLAGFGIAYSRIKNCLSKFQKMLLAPFIST
jgi:hypothetical protein